MNHSRHLFETASVGGVYGGAGIRTQAAFPALGGSGL